MSDQASRTTGADGSVARPNPRKTREGVVVSTAMEKTVVVRVTSQVRHRLYGKTLRQNKKLYAHDTDHDLNVGDRVRVQETRPLSKTKRWRVIDVVERAK